MAAGTSDRHEVTTATHGLMRHTAERMSFNRNRAHQVGHSRHHGLHPLEVAQALLANIACDNDINCRRSAQLFKCGPEVSDGRYGNRVVTDTCTMKLGTFATHRQINVTRKDSIDVGRHQEGLAAILAWNPRGDIANIIERDIAVSHILQNRIQRPCSIKFIV